MSATSACSPNASPAGVLTNLDKCIQRGKLVKGIIPLPFALVLIVDRPSLAKQLLESEVLVDRLKLMGRNMLLQNHSEFFDMRRMVLAVENLM